MIKRDLKRNNLRELQKTDQRGVFKQEQSLGEGAMPSGGFFAWNLPVFLMLPLLDTMLQMDNSLFARYS